MLGDQKYTLLRILDNRDSDYEALYKSGFPAPSIRREMNQMKGLYVMLVARQKFTLIKFAGNQNCTNCKEPGLIGNKECRYLICLKCGDRSIRNGL